MAITDTATYKTSRQIPGTDFDASLAVGIAYAERYVREYCGRSVTNGFESAERTEVYDGTGRPSIQLREWPVDSIASVKFIESISDGAITFGDAIDGSGYYADERGLLIRAGSGTDQLWRGVGVIDGPVTRGPYWPKVRNSIQVVYTAGYSTMPQTLVEAVHTIVDSWLATRGEDTLRANTENRGVEQRVNAMPAEVEARVASMLSEWSRPYA